MLHIPNLHFSVNPTSIVENVINENKEFLTTDRPRKRLLQTISQGIDKSSLSIPVNKSWTLRLNEKPMIISADEQANSNTAVILKLQSTLTGEFTTLATDLVIKCIGYTMETPLAVLPFSKDHVINSGGRVDVTAAMDGNDNNCPVYVAGWLKRGPKGVIAATRIDAYDTAETMIEDIKANMIGSTKSTSVQQAIEEDLRNRNIQWITWEDWLKLDALECDSGLRIGTPRQKLRSLEDVFKAIQV